MRKSAQHLRGRGFSLIEAMFLMTILSVVALSAGVSLQSLARVPNENDDQLAISNSLVDRIEVMRGTAFASLTVGTTNENVTINGQPLVRTTTIALADADNSGAANADFKQITVTIGNRSLVTYVVEP